MIGFSKEIYKKDVKGQIRVFWLSCKGNKILQRYGLVDGKQTNKIKFCKGKNIGRSNETSPEEQAVKEANAIITKKLSEGYFETISEAKSVEIILPMLAKSYEKEKHKIDWSNCYVQPKLDGMRCLDFIDKRVSRKNKPITTMDHIKVKRPGPWGFTLDGELYAHGLSFQDNMKLIKKKSKESKTVKFHVYDLISYLPFALRYKELKIIVEASENLELVPTFKITCEKELKDYHQRFLSEGYEGTIVRWGTRGYEINKRSDALLKYKDFKDLALKIEDVIPNEQEPTHGTFVFKWEGAKGHRLGDDILGCGMKFSHNEREYILKNKHEYIGKTAEIRFFEYSDTGVPRFPVCVGIRLDK